MTVTIHADGQSYIIANPDELRIEAESITFEASVEDGRQIYIYSTKPQTSQEEN